MSFTYTYDQIDTKKSIRIIYICFIESKSTLCSLVYLYHTFSISLTTMSFSLMLKSRASDGSENSYLDTKEYILSRKCLCYVVECVYASKCLYNFAKVETKKIMYLKKSTYKLKSETLKILSG